MLGLGVGFGLSGVGRVGRGEVGSGLVSGLG